MKTLVKKWIPYPVILFFKTHIERINLLRAYLHDAERFLYHSSMLQYDNQGIKLVATIIRNYHVIEKGLTMPETRLGFGQDRMLQLIDQCIRYISYFDRNDEQIKHASQVIAEYITFHEENNYQLNKAIISKYNDLILKYGRIDASSQISISREDYFAKTNKSFLEFSSSRSSIRNYCNEEIPIQKITDSIDIARNTPSACNRQTSRVYVYTDKQQISKILEIQGGNRGFGHLANKLIIMTAELGVFNSVSERNQAFIDGGMYAMNILYSLHYHQVAGCILNCSTDPKKDKELRRVCGIKESEVFIAMISCGIPPKTFKIASSKRFSMDYMTTYIPSIRIKELIS
ncbi:nitroreductase family protein [Dyadobacter tibetensis]|uniref:nitroreductase family protein n=1 Tax=Dyadobacter tibetensis TaxID=1211851 RepID=UPI00046FCA19|nr:nitroreductase family protein [Dyadobacter tibetensis]